MSTPVIVLSHRKREFLETTIQSIRENLVGAGPITLIDDSGDADHHDWIDDIWVDRLGLHGAAMHSENLGYLESMRSVWEIAKWIPKAQGGRPAVTTDYVMLWEEDFLLTQKVDVDDMIKVMEANSFLAQLNLQRQAVYAVERRLGYMESHARRGYRVAKNETAGVPWVRRNRPFTTNPGLLRTSVLDIDWPSREEADQFDGGAEPAMSARLEAQGYAFGWYGRWNTPATEHVGSDMKSGIGY